MRKFLVLAAMSVLAASLSNAAVVTYSDSGLWSTAVDNTFNTFQFAGNFNSTPAGATVVISQTVPNAFSGISGVVPNQLYQDVLGSGQWPNQVNSTFTAPSSTTYAMTTAGDPPLYGVGGTWATSVNGEGGGVNVLLNLFGGGTFSFVMSGPGVGTNGFFGWVSDTPFTSFVLSTNNNLLDNFGRPYGLEHYTVDNLQIAAVPEPATFSIVGLALLGLGAFKRYRRN